MLDIRPFAGRPQANGDARPSESDKRVTRKLATAAEALDCAVLDHLVFGGRDVSSLRQLGYL